MIQQVTLYATGDNALAIDKAVKTKPKGFDGMTAAAKEARKICFGLIEQYCDLTGIEFDSVGIGGVEIDTSKGKMRYKITALFYKEGENNAFD